MKSSSIGKPLWRLKMMLLERFDGRQFRAANHFGIQECTLSHYLSGRKPIPESLIIKIERTLGCDRDVFLSSAPVGRVK